MANLQIIIKELERQVKKLFSSDSSGHDFYHLQRVLNLALHIQEKEGGDLIVVAVAAFLHDVHRIMQNKKGKYCSPKDSLPKVRSIIQHSSLPASKIDKVLECVELHEEYDFSDQGKTARTIECFIVQDADNLDAMGAVGIARVFSFGGAHGIPIWVPEIQTDNQSNWDETKPQSPHQIQHFYEKLLRLKDNMNTSTAKKIAASRHKFMEKYLEQFFKEWHGEA